MYTNLNNQYYGSCESDGHNVQKFVRDISRDGYQVIKNIDDLSKYKKQINN